MSATAVDLDCAAAHSKCVADPGACFQVPGSVDLCLPWTAVLVEVEVALRLKARRVARMLQ